MAARRGGSSTDLPRPQQELQSGCSRTRQEPGRASGPRRGTALIGTTIAHYRITTAIGAGGMGEVYRATDTNLGRDVAIKVLPAELARDPERLARFEREAKLLASLNHTNIAHVYGFEAATLEDGSSAHFLAMELVEGEDLAERLRRGPIPVDETLGVARQIAEALEEAHEHGIVHRDLKPANVKLTSDGTVKVLDFGLAKAYAGDAGMGSGSDLSQSPTLAHTGTQAGVILGTAAYMSPEQARGKAVDKRSDIWAFGVLLFEMLTGRRLFAGETVSDVLAGVLKTEIALDALPSATPPAIRQTLRRCLERNRKNRLHDIADARLAIDEVLAGTLDEGPRAAPAATGRWRGAVSWTLAAVAVVWAAWASVQASRGAARPAPPGVAFTVPWRSSDSPREILQSVALSRDGRRLLVWDGENVLLRDLDRLTMRVLTLPAGVRSPFFSPDGQWIGFAADGKIQKVALAGGDPVKLCDSPSLSPGGAWGADGFLYFTPGWNSGLWRVPEEGGSPERLSEPDESRPGSFHGWPSPLPDGRGVLFTIWGRAGAIDARIGYFDAASRDVVEVTRGAAAQYLTTGEIVFFRHGSWFAAPFNPRSRKLTGPERRVLEAMRPLSPPGDAERSFSFSDDGRLAYVAGAYAFTTPHSQLAWVDRAGHVEPQPFEGPHEYGSLALSPDDRRAAVALAQEGELQIWVYDLASGTRERLTRDGQNLHPRWSPDGTRLVVTSLVRGDFDLRWISASALAAPNDLVVTAVDDYRGEWTPDGRAIVFVHASPETGDDIWTRGTDDTGPGRPVVVTPDSDSFPSVSPDGHWLLYRGAGAFYVTRFPEADERMKISPDGSSAASWSPSTREIFVVEADQLVAIRYETSGGRFRTTGSQVLFEVPQIRVDGRVPVSHDARRFLMFVPVPGKTLDPEVRVVTDGFAALRGEATAEP